MVSVTCDFSRLEMSKPIATSKLMGCIAASLRVCLMNLSSVAKAMSTLLVSVESIAENLAVLPFLLKHVS